MKQVWISKVGGPEVLQMREAPDPIAKPGELRIRVKASGINFADLLARQGLYPDAPKLPAVVGYEVAGIVDQAEAGTGFQSGDRVGSITRFGGYSDTVVVPAAMAFRLPKELSFESAAAIPVNYLTAWLMLIHQGNVKKGDKVLIHAAAGGVGQAALQICRWKEAEVYGTASASKHARLKELGVRHCIDYHTQDFEAEILRLTDKRGVDIVLDAVGGESYRKSFRCLAPLGKLMMFGASTLSSGKNRKLWAVAKGLWKMPSFKAIPLMNQNRGVLGFNLGHLWDRQALLQSSLAEILDLVAARTFRPLVDKTFPMEQAAQAHAYLHEHQNFGKVLLTA
ncbi:MAG: medium chain dehydrogenase/reductase family protein [Deltaproteobacteria bacterium]|nr:medium chain dehydrogenase/reductase family protein [Deltaproteobacteria bacterium]